MLQVNGISLHVEDHGSGRPVLLLHGWSDSAYLWRNQIPFLVVNGFHAIAPDLRGFGRSDRRLELELSSSRALAPAGTRNRMDFGAQIRTRSASFWRQTVITRTFLSEATSLKEAKTLSEEHKAVLLVTIGYRRKGGVSKTRVGEILGLEASFYLDDLLSQGLIYCDPVGELNFWRLTPSALLALGLRSSTDIPVLKELEEWFDAQKEFEL